MTDVFVFILHTPLGNFNTSHFIPLYLIHCIRDLKQLSMLFPTAGLQGEFNESDMQANLSTEVAMVVLDVVCLYTSTFKVDFLHILASYYPFYLS